MSDELPELRASDAERERAARALRVAADEGRLDVDELEERLGQAYAARTQRELTALLADVTVRGAAPVIPAAGGEDVPRLVPVRPGGGDGWVVSIMSGSDRRGRWRVGPHLRVLNLMGGSDIDLNDAELGAEEVVITVVSIMGGGNIRVPEGLDVDVTRFALMGGDDIRLGAEDPLPGSPRVRLRLWSLMGGNSVRRGRRRRDRDRRRERELEREERRARRHLGHGG